MIKNPPASEGDIRDLGSITGLGRSPENSFLYYIQKNSPEIRSAVVIMALGTFYA